MINFFNITFVAIPEKMYGFLAYRHLIDSALFKVLAPEFEVTHLKLHEAGYTPIPSTQNELFFIGKNKFFYLPFAIVKYLKKSRPKVVLIHGFVFPIQTLILRKILSNNTLFIIQHHAEKPYSQIIKQWFQKIAYSKMDAYLFASRSLADVFIDKGIIADPLKVHEVMEGSSPFIKTDKIQARTKIKVHSKTIFLWVGRLDKNKDPLTVLKAVNEYRIKDKEFKLIMIYGNNELESEILQFITSHNLTENICLIGKIDHQELQDWYSALDYFISASHYEGSGIALCEAMSCGCVPIVTRIPSFMTMTDNGRCGYLYEAGDHKQLLSILLGLSNDNYVELENRILIHFKNVLSFQSIGMKIKSLVLQLMK